MRIVALFVGACLHSGLATQASTRNETETSQQEKDIQDAFKAAYSNRSSELKEFFNETFHGEPSEIADRFRQSWDSASDGVKQFVSETYQNISQIMKGENSTAPNAGLAPFDDIKEKITNAIPEDTSDSTHPPRDMLDSAWGYFKSVFGVDPRATPEPKESDNSSDQPSASLPIAPQPPSSAGFMFGLVTIAAALFLLYQTSSVNSKSVLNVSDRSSPQKRRHEVPSGYVRLT